MPDFSESAESPLEGCSLISERLRVIHLPLNCGYLWGLNITPAMQKQTNKIFSDNQILGFLAGKDISSLSQVYSWFPPRRQTNQLEADVLVRFLNRRRAGMPKPLYFLVEPLLPAKEQTMLWALGSKWLLGSQRGSRYGKAYTDETERDPDLAPSPTLPRSRKWPRNHQVGGIFLFWVSKGKKIAKHASSSRSLAQKTRIWEAQE